jgi:GNAT superfamily N-acetyltransferase
MRLYELAESKLQPFSTEPNTPNQMDMLKDPEYMAKKKGMVGSVEWMSPEDYIERCERGFKSTGSQGLVRQGRDPKLIKQYAQDMQKGDVFPMLELDYRDGFSQEGLHRAMAAEMLGVEKVPVWVTRTSPEFQAKRDAERRSEFDKIKAQASEWEKERQSSVVDDILGAFESKLTEGISPVLYHFMGIASAANVFKQDKFRLTAAPGTDAERRLQHGDRFYYLSTTRHKLGGYHLNNSNTGVLLELDGEKLSHNYSGKAVDYWGPEWYPGKAAGGKGPEEKEAEDRVYSRKPYIPNASKYIKSVHILYDERGQKTWKKIGVYVRRLMIDAKKQGIPAYLYMDKDAWIKHDTRNAVDPRKVELVAKAQGKEMDQDVRFSSVDRRFISPWIELYKAPVGSKLSKRADDTRYNYVLYGYGNDAARSLAADIHNAKSKDAKETGLDTLIQIFRKEGIKTPQEYIDLLQNKWRPKEESINEATEIEFVCVNDAFDDATKQEQQDELFDALRDVQGILVYRQDFGEHNSMAAIIQDESAIPEVERLAKENGVKIDMYNDVSERFIDSIYTGELEGLVDWHGDINEYTEIAHDTENDEGNIFGYVVDTDEEQLVNYFVMNHGVSMDVIDAIKAEYKTIAIARGMTVEDEHMNKGHGTELLEAFIEEAAENGAQAILIVADIYEDNEFDLVKWYERWGFQTITQTSAGPMMILEL